MVVVTKLADVADVVSADVDGDGGCVAGDDPIVVVVVAAESDC